MWLLPSVTQMYSYWYAGKQDHACLLWPAKAVITLRVILSSLINQSSSFISVPWSPLPLSLWGDNLTLADAQVYQPRPLKNCEHSRRCTLVLGEEKALTTHKPRQYWYKLYSMYVSFFSSSLFSSCIVSLLTITFVIYFNYHVHIACTRIVFFLPHSWDRESACVLTQGAQGRGLNIPFKAAQTKSAVCPFQVKRENILFSC